jgi:GWxTD domain-containing protein
MTRKCFAFPFLFSICIVGLFSTVSFAQQQPRDKPMKVKSEKRDAFKRWFDEVEPIMTEAEKKAFLKLETDDEREKFIDIFWGNRDPDPDTEINEFKEEYYERMQYANEHFSSGIPGWKTDRGQIYLRWGKPDSIESHPTGGQYDYPLSQGGGSTSTYPFEVWFYRNLPGIDSGIEFEFVDRTGSGEYRLANSPDEKNALSSIPGNDRQNRISGRDSLNYGRAQDSPFAIYERNTKALTTPPPLNRPISDIESTGSAIDNNALEFDMRIDFYKQSDERVVTAISIQAENKGLIFTDEAGINTARLNIRGSIISLAQKRVGTFEEAVTTNATAIELASVKERKSVYQKAVTLQPGVYKVRALVRDIKSGAAGVRELSLYVPKYEAGKLSTSSLVLASRLQNKTDEMQGNIFVIGAHKVIPNIANTFQRGQDVGIYLQIYNAGIDETTLRPNVDVEYVLQKDGKEILKQDEDWQGLSDSGQRLVLARLLPTTSLNEGEYKLSIRIRDRVSGQVLIPKTTFSVTK